MTSMIDNLAYDHDVREHWSEFLADAEDELGMHAAILFDEWRRERGLVSEGNSNNGKATEPS
jgi:hypothetical protein